MGRKKTIVFDRQVGRRHSQGELNGPSSAMEKKGEEAVADAKPEAPPSGDPAGAADVGGQSATLLHAADAGASEMSQPAAVAAARKRGRPKKAAVAGQSEEGEQGSDKPESNELDDNKLPSEHGEDNKDEGEKQSSELDEDKMVSDDGPSRRPKLTARKRGRPRKSVEESQPLEGSKESSLAEDRPQSEEQMLKTPKSSSEVDAGRLESDSGAKRSRGRPKKSTKESLPLLAVDQLPSEGQVPEPPKPFEKTDAVQQESESNPKRGRGRPKKSTEGAEESSKAEKLEADSKRKRGRPRKSTEEAQPMEGSQESPVAGRAVEELKESSDQHEQKADDSLRTSEADSKRKRGRPKKSAENTQPLQDSKESPKHSEVEGQSPEDTGETPFPLGKPQDDAQQAKATPLPAEQIPDADRKSESLEPNDELDSKSKEVEVVPKRKKGRPRKSDAEKTTSKRAGKSENTSRATRAADTPTPVVETQGKRVSLRNKMPDEELDGRQEASAGKGKKVASDSQGEKRGRKRRGGSDQAPASGRGPISAEASPSKKASVPRADKIRDLNRVEIDGVVFLPEQTVYVRKSDASGEESDAELEDCQICGTLGQETMLECDDCLAGYHLRCLSPPLEDVPEGDWKCSFCEKGEKPPERQPSQSRHRSARERLLARDLWAARIERMWKAKDGTYMFRARWYIVPEETALGRQSHNGKRELFLSERSDDNQMGSILRHCFIMSPQDYKAADGEGDDVFVCEYEYNELHSNFKKIRDLDDNEMWSEADIDEPYSSDESGDASADDGDGRRRRRRISGGKKPQAIKIIRAANKRRNYSGGIQEVGAKTIPEGIRKRPQTEFDRAKAALASSAVPTSLPCRDRERTEISAFVKVSVAAAEKCLGRCLYISGVPGTGKTATVLEVIKELGKKVDRGELPPYRFVEINGLKLPSPEHAYTMFHEALTGQHLGWKRALQYLDERFSNEKPGKGVEARPCVLLVDELDHLITRNQSVLYNLFDWPGRAQSRLIVIGIANTMDLPERMLPRIASRMGMQRISFAPYSHKQLEEIISARLTGVQVFDKQAAEFASRKVAAVSGDTRRALELCRRAVEICESRVKRESSCAPVMPFDTAATTNRDVQASVTMSDVDAAISEMFEAPQIKMMKRSAKLEKIFLVAMIYEQRRTATTETTFERIASTCSELCASNGEESPEWDTLLSVGCKLGESRLLLCESGARHRLQKLQLNVPCDDISFALRTDEKIPWMDKYL